MYSRIQQTFEQERKAVSTESYDCPRNALGCCLAKEIVPLNVGIRNAPLLSAEAWTLNNLLVLARGRQT
jgi:hypothetical protein